MRFSKKVTEHPNWREINAILHEKDTPDRRLVYMSPEKLREVSDRQLKRRRDEDDEEFDYLVLAGLQPHFPKNGQEMDKGEPCRTCGFRLTEPVVRARATFDSSGHMVCGTRKGKVVCSDCCRCSDDDEPDQYFGHPVDMFKSEKWLAEYHSDDNTADSPATPTSYAGSLRSKVETRRERRAKARANEQGKGE